MPSLIVAIHGQSFDPPSSRSGSAITNLAALDAFFRRAFGKTPGERFATALDLSDGLAAAIDGKPMTPRETAASRTAYGAPLDGSASAARKGETAMFAEAPGKPGAMPSELKATPPATDPGAPLDAPALAPKPAERTEYGTPSVVETPTKPSADPVPVIAPIPAATNAVEPPPRAAEKRPAWIVPAALVGAAAVGVLVWLAVRNNTPSTDGAATQASGSATMAPSASTRVANGPKTSASAVASGEAPSAPALPSEFDVPEGTPTSDADGGEVYATGFHVRVLDATQKSLTAAFATCKDMSMLPCTDFQWKRACTHDASLAGRDTWTSSELQAKSVIDGGKTCNDQSLGTFHGPAHAVVCCDPAVAATQTGGHLGKDSFMSRVGYARDYPAAMDAENIKKVVASYDENVDFNGTSRPRDALGAMGKSWFSQHPDQTYAYGVCALQSSGGAGWNLACPAMIYRDAKLLRLDVRLGFTSDDHVRQVGEDGVRDLPD